jgi:putative addiction module antidote
MFKVKVKKVGNSLGAILPGEMAARLRVKEGDSLSVTETPDGIQLSPYDFFDRVAEKRLAVVAWPPFVDDIWQEDSIFTVNTAECDQVKKYAVEGNEQNFYRLEAEPAKLV